MMNSENSSAVENFRLCLAPMDAITHQAFRNLVGRFGGCDEYFNEMINASSLINNGPWEKYYLFDGPEPEKLVWQLTDKNGEKMATAAKIVGELNGLGVDLNMGCSAPQISKTGAGIAWMFKPLEETGDMVRRVKTELENAAKDGTSPKRLSAKFRLGGEDYTEEKLFEFCQMLADEGVELFTLHGRTQKQKHSRHSDWKMVEKLAQRFPKIPVILNGDVKDKDSFEAARQTAPSAAGIMIATAAAQKPWIFRQCRAEENSEPVEFDAMELAMDFISDVEKFQPKEFWKTRLQRFFAFYCLNFSFGHFFQSSMINATDNDDARKRLSEYFEKCPQDRIKRI